MKLLCLAATGTGFEFGTPEWEAKMRAALLVVTSVFALRLR